MKPDHKCCITIVGWEKHQREMKGGEKRRRRRDWVAISTDLCRDPDILDLTIEQRWCWIALLCHAGRVGPVFDLSPSDARVLFQLRRSADFEVLADHGLIDLRTATRQDRTGQTRQDSAQAKKPPAPAKKKTEVIEYPEGLNETAFEAYKQNRRELRCKKLTPTGEKRQAKHMATYPEHVQEAAVEQSIRNGWQGVFPEKVKPEQAETDQEYNRRQIQEWLDDKAKERDRQAAEIRESDGEGAGGLPSQEAGPGNIRALPQRAG